MVFRTAASLLVLVLSFGLGSCFVDLCGKIPCPPDLPQHTTCGATGGFLSTCPSSARIVQLSAADQQYLMDGHNKLRNKIASGNEPGFSPSKFMATMTWDDQLAEYAELNVRRCIQHQHDCHNTFKQRNSAQNLQMSARTDKFEELRPLIDGALSAWYAEKENASQSYVESCCGPVPPSPNAFLHFVAIVTGNSNRIGCAVVQFKDESDKYPYQSKLTCNYAYMTVQGTYMYRSGPTASDCKSGTNPYYPGLCSTDEDIDVNEIGEFFGRDSLNFSEVSFG